MNPVCFLLVHFIREVAPSRLFLEPLNQGLHKSHNIGGSEEDVFVEMLHEDVLDLQRFLFLIKLEVENLVTEHVLICHEILDLQTVLDDRGELLGKNTS